MTATSGLAVGGAQTVAEPAESAESVDTVAVRQGNLTQDREFTATINFGEKWAVNTAAAGTITEQHPVGTVIEPGEILVRLDNKPLFVGRGAMPMYRELSKVNTRVRDGNGKRLDLLSGSDVAQLQAFLLEAGFDAGGKLEADDIFGASTETAVKAWQKSVGLAVTGRIDNTQIVFSPDPVRIASESRIGAPFEGIEVDNAQPAVLVDTSNRDRAAFPDGREVEIVLTDDTTLTGTVTAQKQETGSDGSQFWRTTITASGPLPADASSATVNVTDVVAEDVMFVPAGALLAVAEGGFAVERVDGAATSLVRVEVGEVIEGQAEITGDIAVGDEVVVAV